MKSSIVDCNFKVLLKFFQNFIINSSIFYQVYCQPLDVNIYNLIHNSCYNWKSHNTIMPSTFRPYSDAQNEVCMFFNLYSKCITLNKICSSIDVYSMAFSTIKFPQITVKSFIYYKVNFYQWPLCEIKLLQ